MNAIRHLIAVVVLSAALVNADPPKPRVMVILDTSKSMLEPTNADNPVIPMSAAGGDFDPATNPACSNKFCTAKKVIYNVIPQFTTEARIGLASYYQFVLQADKADTRQTQCIYDVLAPAGQKRQFQSLIDLTASGNTTCPTATCDAYGICTEEPCANGARAVNYPDGFGSPSGAGARLDETCNGFPAGYSRPATLPNTVAPSCVGARCYSLTKTAATANVPVACAIYSPTPVTSAGAPLPFPVNYASASSACTTSTYTGMTSQAVYKPGALPILKYIAPGSPVCPGVASPEVTSPATAPEVFTSGLPVGTAANQWGNVGLLTNTNCKTNSPCLLYLSDTTPVNTNTSRSWYAFFNDPYVPPAAAVSPTTLPSYPFSSSTASVGYVADFFRANVASPLRPRVGGLPAATLCATVGSYGNGNSLAGFGVNNALSQLDGSAISRGARAHESPGRTGGQNINCTDEFPCDITGVNDIPDPPVWAGPTTIYDPAGVNPAGFMSVVTGTRRFTTAAQSAGSPLATNAYTFRVTNYLTHAACPAIGVTTSNPNPADVLWTVGPPGGCGAGQFQCTFSAPTQMNVTAPAGTCPSPFSKFNTTSAGNCSYNNRPYSGPTNFANDGMGNPYRAVVNVPTTQACTMGTVNATNIANFMAGYATTTTNIPSAQVTAANPASLTYVSEPAGPPQTSGTGWNKLSPVAGYSGAPFTEANRGGTTILGPPAPGSPSDPSGGCAGAVGAEVQMTNATLCGGAGTCTLIVVGPEVVSNNCGAAELNKPCYQCRYQPRQYTWQRPTKNCTYSAQRSDFTVNRDSITCTYNRPQWNIETLQPSTHTCEYTIGARRYDFDQPATTACRYFAVQTNIESPRTMYTYEYLTKGTELIGRATSAGTAGDLCSTAWAAAPDPFGTECPETVPNCTGLTSQTMQATAYLSQSTCKLRWGGPNSNGSNDFKNYVTRGGLTNGRVGNYNNANIFFSTVDLSHKACEATASPPVSPNTYKSQTGAPRGFCAPSGTGPQTERKLISDYYDPNPATNANNLAATYGPLYPAASGWTVTWNNSATKAQGFGAHIGVPAGATGDLPTRSLFVPIPDDLTYSAGAQRTAIEQAMRKCVLPSVDAPGADGSLDGGACVADERIRPVGPTGDFTPLYGSLRSTYDYLNARWSVDGVDERQCRDYFIVLATDGLENTPMGYSVGGVDPLTSVQGLVSSFRNTAPGVKTRPDVRTFVIAMGTGAAGEPALNNVASSGGTTQAFNATNLAELETALQAVFTTITQGVFSRSRPALGTDGTRLYAAQFIRPSSTGPLPDGGYAGPDWSGLLTAYRVDPIDGTFGLAWEHSAKLNDASHPARDIVIGLRKKSDSSKLVVPFTNASGELVDQLNDDPSFPGGMTSNDVINFLRNNGDTYYGALGARSSKLGPIVHSTPVVVGKSPFDPDYGGPTAADRAAFATFKTNVDTRPVRLLFGAGDGMVHSVVEGSTAPACTTPGEADVTCPSGREDWSFIPGSLSRGWINPTGRPTVVESLYRLKKGEWSMALINNTISIADVCGNSSGLANSCGASDWKTIAIVTQREGGRGVMALDITDPSATPDTNKFLWDYEEGDLGLTYSVPAIGRIKHDGDQEFVAIFGGGLDDPGTGGWGEWEGRRIYIVNALTGSLIKEYNKFDKGSSFDNDLYTEVLARPAIHRRTGPNFSFISSAFVLGGQNLFAMRFLNADGSFDDDENHWKPDEVFDPTSPRNLDRATCASPPCGTVSIRQVVETAPGNPVAVPPVPPTYGLVPATGWTTAPLLPLDVAPPAFIRPRLAPILVQNGAQIDLFYGTGDVRDPANPSGEFQDGNYFYAIHDFNQQLSGANNDGRALWIAKFPRIGASAPYQYEQVVSEPAIISGCVVVATYTTALVGGACNVEGDTTLYGFRPLDGELQPCLTYLAPSPYAGMSTSVIKMTGVGIPSDLVVINDNVYLSTSKDGLTRAPVKVPPKPGAVRSYRRIK